MKGFIPGKDEPAVPVMELNRPDNFTTTDDDSIDYYRWMTHGSFDADDVFTEDTAKKVVICRMTIAAGMGKNEGAYDTWANKATANYVPWSLVPNIIK